MTSIAASRLRRLVTSSRCWWWSSLSKATCKGTIRTVIMTSVVMKTSQLIRHQPDGWRIDSKCAMTFLSVRQRSLR